MISEDTLAPNAMYRLASEGFLTATVPEGVRTAIDSTFRRGAAFFRQEVEAKIATSVNGDFGYRSYGVEYSSSPERPDQMESFTVGRLCLDRLSQLPNAAGRALAGEMAQSLKLFASVASSLIASLASYFGQNSSKQLSGSIEDWSILQLNYSRPCAAIGEFVNEEHEDGCLVTVASVTGHGLEMRSNQGHFVPATPAHNQLLLFPGEILHLLTAGVIKPCYHRVNVLNYLPERMSLLLFADINPALCAPWLIGDVNRGVDIGERVLKNSSRFGLKEWAVERNALAETMPLIQVCDA